VMVSTGGKKGKRRRSTKGPSSKRQKAVDMDDVRARGEAAAAAAAAAGSAGTSGSLADRQKVPTRGCRGGREP